MSLSSNPFYQKSKEATRKDAQEETKGALDKQALEAQHRVQQHHTRVSADLSRIETELKKKENELVTIDREIKELQEESAGHKKQAETKPEIPKVVGPDLEHDIQTLTTEIATDKRHQRDLQTKLSDAQTKEKEAARAHSTAHTEIQHEKRELEKVEKEEEATKGGIKKLEEKAKDLEVELAEVRIDIQEERTDLTNLEAEAREHHQKIEALEEGKGQTPATGDVVKIEGDLQKITVDIREKETQLANDKRALTAQEEQARADASRARSEAAQEKTALLHTDQKLRDAERKRGKVAGEIDDLKRRVMQLENELKKAA